MKSQKTPPPAPVKPATPAVNATQPPSQGTITATRPPLTDPESPVAITAIGMTRTNEGWSVIRYLVSGREVIEAELLGDEPAMSKARADDLIRVEVARKFLFQVE